MSQMDTESTVIGGLKYSVYKLDPLVANDILIDIGHLIGPSFGDLTGAYAGAAGNGGGPSSAMIAEAIGGLFKRLDKTTLRGLIDTLSKCTEVEVSPGKTPRLNTIFSAHFQGQIGLMYEWLWFALKVQYQNFFDSARPAIDRAVQLVGLATSPSQDTSTSAG